MQTGKSSSIMKGVGIGMAVGGVSAIVGSMMTKSAGKSPKRKAAKAMKNVSGMLDSIQCLMK